jgi:simple sugar transport system ATP-binding protein
MNKRMNKPLVRLDGLTKNFGPIQACRDISLDLNRGEILALVGENGAGKSTLVNILSGMVRPDAGRVWIDTRAFMTLTPSQAQANGIATVYQNFQLIPELTVMENIVLGRESARWGAFIDKAGAKRKIEELTSRFPIVELPLELPAARLERGHWQYVEILRALYRDPELLVLDEPTALMPPQFIDAFLDFIKALGASGKSIVLVSHRLDEVAAVADRVAMLRRGELLGILERPFLVQDLVARLGWHESIDDEAAAHVAPASHEIGKILLQAESITTNAPMNVSLHEISLSVARGELVGLLGANGNGQRELVDLLLGLHGPDEGELRINCGRRDVAGMPVSSVCRAYIPSDTLGRGVAVQLNLVQNLMLGFQRTPEWAPRGRLLWRRVESWCRNLVERYSIRAEGCREPLSNLSGGNRQKAVVARELARGPMLLLAEYPFKGLDLSTHNAVASNLREFAAAGGGVLLVDSDAENVRMLCQRIYVIWRGHIRVTLNHPFPSKQELLGLMAGTEPI